MIRAACATDAIELGLRLHGTAGDSRSLPPVHVGVHTGPAIQRAGDWWGATVNIASRVADAAEAGQLLITEATRHAAGQCPAQLRGLGSVQFRNISAPVSVYAAGADDGVESLGYRRRPKAVARTPPSTHSRWRHRREVSRMLEQTTRSQPTAGRRGRCRAGRAPAAAHAAAHAHRHLGMADRRRRGDLVRRAVSHLRRRPQTTSTRATRPSCGTCTRRTARPSTGRSRTRCGAAVRSSSSIASIRPDGDVRSCTATARSCSTATAPCARSAPARTSRSARAPSRRSAWRGSWCWPSALRNRRGGARDGAEPHLRGDRARCSGRRGGSRRTPATWSSARRGRSTAESWSRSGGAASRSPSSPGRGCRASRGRRTSRSGRTDMKAPDLPRASFARMAGVGAGLAVPGARRTARWRSCSSSSGARPAPATRR